MAFVGPEAPLAAGVADALWEAGIPVVGPKKACAIIEFDKAWARNFMKKYGIEGCPAYEVFTEEKPAHAFIEKLGDVAVKPSGLTGGKGVKVMGDQLPDLEAAKAYTSELLEKGAVVIEETLYRRGVYASGLCGWKKPYFLPCRTGPQKSL